MYAPSWWRNSRNSNYWCTTIHNLGYAFVIMPIFFNLDSFWHCFGGEKNDYYTLFMVLLFFEFCIKYCQSKYSAIVLNA
jgi:hypothetical protein